MKNRTEDREENYLIVGLTGSIGAGKSQVAEHFREAGIPVLSADSIAKELMAGNSEIRGEIIDLLGENAYVDGELDRRWIAQQVFSDRELLDGLNRIVHPATIVEQGVRALKLIREGAGIVLCEAALIYESGGEDRFDYVIVVDADRSTRLRRAAARDNVSIEEIERRDSMQIPAEEKVRNADFVITNDGNLEELRMKTNLIISLLQTLPPRHQLEAWDDLFDESEGENNQDGIDS